MTPQVKNLRDEVLDVSESWVNYSGVGEIDRMVSSHHFKGENKEHHSNLARYSVRASHVAHVSYHPLPSHPTNSSAASRACAPGRW